MSKFNEAAAAELIGRAQVLYEDVMAATKECEWGFVSHHLRVASSILYRAQYRLRLVETELTRDRARS